MDPFSYLNYTAEELANARVELFPSILPLRVDKHGKVTIMAVRRNGTETSAPWTGYWENFVSGMEDDGRTLLQTMADDFEDGIGATIDKVVNAQLASVGPSEDGEHELVFAWYMVKLHCPAGWGYLCRGAAVRGGRGAQRTRHLQAMGSSLFLEGIRRTCAP